MIWNSVSEFWAMGGYGEYVWGSFGVTALFMALEVAQVRHDRHQTLQRLRMMHDALADDAEPQA